MFRHPAWAVGSYSSGPPAAGTVGTKSTGGCYHSDWSPCKFSIEAALSLTVDRLDACVLLLLRLPERICVERDPQGFDGGAHPQYVILQWKGSIALDGRAGEGACTFDVCTEGDGRLPFVTCP